MAEKPKREKTRPPFFMVPSAVSSRRDLELADKLVFGVIVTRIGSNGHCWPGLLPLGFLSHGSAPLSASDTA